MPEAISNASPLIQLAKIGQLSLLAHLYPRVLIPTAEELGRNWGSEELGVTQQIITGFGEKGVPVSIPFISSRPPI